MVSPVQPRKQLVEPGVVGQGHSDIYIVLLKQLSGTPLAATGLEQ